MVKSSKDDSIYSESHPLVAMPEDSHLPALGHIGQEPVIAGCPPKMASSLIETSLFRFQQLIQGFIIKLINTDVLLDIMVFVNFFSYL